jgi:DNA-binding transcriptional MerR regulator
VDAPERNNAPVAVWGGGIAKGLRAFVPLLLVSVGLSACGGGDGANDERKVEEAIEFALTSTDPSACGEYRTVAFMEETTSATGAAAERECEESVKSRASLPDSVTVSKIEIEDGEASAEVAFEGGDGDGLVLNVVLVEDEGSWKIDDFTGVAGVDRDRLVARIVKQLEKQGMSARGVRCMADGLSKLPPAELERAVFGEGDRVATGIAEDCEASARAEQLAAKTEREEERQEQAELEAEEEAEEQERLEREAEQPAGYPRAVQQNFLSSCLATSGSNFEGCECTLEQIEARYSLSDLMRAEANLASGEMREMIEYALAACA